MNNNAYIRLEALLRFGVTPNGYTPMPENVIASCSLTLHKPLSPDDVIETNLVLEQNLDALEVLPLRRGQPSTATQ